ncbi:MAG: thioredoxin domain-containing protein [Pseudomonadota bacterium]
MIANTPHQNLLANQTSPYLLQHAGNPVNWYPWGEAAFAAARESGKPVLLSIGYSACHWCHVMAHESFEDEATAQVMNDLFINIKVDREERPDIDRIYQMAHQLLTQRSGGWPLTMFLMPDQRPFIGGTYFPPTESHGMPAFRTLLARVADYYHQRQVELQGQSQALVEAFVRIDQTPDSPTATLTDAPLHALRKELGTRFDKEYGGWGPAPKFPHAGIIQRLLRDWRATAAGDTPDLQALFMATLTLKRMVDGGIYDQLGGGFARYSVDERWELPHFEKMLYDNGALLSALSDASLATGDALFARATRATAQYLLRDCRLPSGAFCSSFDADSEGHEGKFYVWKREEIESALGPDAAQFCAHYGLDSQPNFEGRWHLTAHADFDALSVEDQQRLDRSRATLLALRSRRIWPGRDDKVLTSWNALAIRGLADAARALGDPQFTAAAADALHYLQAHHWRDGQLLATSRDDVAHLDAYLDDHALLIDAILALGTVQFSAANLAFAAQLADALLARFEDQANGGFFFTAHDHEALFHRSRVFADDAMPAGNATAASVLLKLGCLLGEPRYLLAAQRTLRAAWPALNEQPLGHVHLVTALEEFLQLPIIVVLRGQPQQLALWHSQLQRQFQPRAMVLAIPADATDLPASLASKAPQGEVVGYLCRGMQCEAPTSSLAVLSESLQRAT